MTSTPTEQTSLEEKMNPNTRVLYGIGIDPGSNSGWSLACCGERFGPILVLECGVLKKPTGAAVACMYDLCYQVATKHAGAPVLRIHVGIENQWTPKLDKHLTEKERRRVAGQIVATVGVAACRGGFEFMAQARGWPADVWHPQTWRKVLGKVQGQKRKTVKERALELVRLNSQQYFGGDPPRTVTDDLAESILINEYNLKQRQAENLQQRSSR